MRHYIADLVFNSHLVGQRYPFNYTAAQEKCESHRAELASYGELYEAWSRDNYDCCRCSFIQGPSPNTSHSIVFFCPFVFSSN